MEAAVAIAVGVAVTRYRLYEIDRLINRTLVPDRRHRCARASLRRRFAARGGRSGGGSTWVTGLAVLVVAVAFGPLRNRAQAAVDWRFDRLRYEEIQRVRAFVDDVARDGESRRRRCRACLGPSRPERQLLFRLPASDVYTDIVGGRAGSRPDYARSTTKVEYRGQEIALLRHKPSLLDHPDLLRAFSPRRAWQLRLRASASRCSSSLPKWRSRGPGRAGRLRRTSAARARSSRRRAAAACDARDRAATVAALAAARGADPRSGAWTRRSTRSGWRSKTCDDRRRRAAATAGRRARGGSCRPCPRRTRPGEPGSDHQRLPEEVEAAAYFVVCEAVTNAVKTGRHRGFASKRWSQMETEASGRR